MINADALHPAQVESTLADKDFSDTNPIAELLSLRPRIGRE